MMTFTAIGQELGVSKARAHQIYKQAIEKLRRRVEADRVRGLTPRNLKAYRNAGKKAARV